MHVEWFHSDCVSCSQQSISLLYTKHRFSTEIECVFLQVVGMQHLHAAVGSIHYGHHRHHHRDE